VLAWGVNVRTRCWIVGLVIGGAPATVAAAPTSEERASLPKNSPDRNTGIGVTLGDPMGISLKHFFTLRHSIQAEFAWMPLHHGSGGACLDYLWHSKVLASSGEVDALGYIGGGLGFGIWGQTTIAGYDGPHYGGDATDDKVHFALMARLPVLGLAFHWVDVPLDTALEGAWSPFVLEVKDPRFGPAHVSVSLKLRYYF
jgi:hypothetical protein